MSPSDHHRFQAAQGWLELGDWQSADEELEAMTPQEKESPDVLRLRVDVFTAAEKWRRVAEAASRLCQVVSDEAFGYIRLAFALHELKRTREAFDVLLPVADKFPATWVIPYNLACYSCQMGDLIGARDWLAQAFRLGGKKEIQKQAMEDPDLAALWESTDSI
jgi:predicted Zn-dependent protease